jgi:VirE N-terminal domain
MPNGLPEVQVNLFPNAFTPVPNATMTLVEAIKAIRGGRYQRQVCAVRQVLVAQGKRAYNKAKGNLPAFTFTGTFNPSRANKHLEQHSGIVVGDMDHVGDVTAAKRDISSDPRTVFAFISPSATALKFGVLVLVVADNTGYRHSWQVVSTEYEQLYGGQWDASGKDVQRLSYVSHDPDAYWNPEAEVFKVPPPPILESRQPTSLQPSATTHISERSDDHAVRAIKTAVQMIQTAVLGTRHHTRLRAARLLGGYIAGGMLNYDQAYTVLEHALNGHTDDMAAALRTVKDGLLYGQAHSITIEALEAERQAWLEAHRPTPHNWHPRQHLNSANRNAHRPARDRYVWGARYHLGGARAR